jgi:hypothetical protein
MAGTATSTGGQFTCTSTASTATRGCCTSTASTAARCTQQWSEEGTATTTACPARRRVCCLGLCTLTATPDIDDHRFEAQVSNKLSPRIARTRTSTT